MYMDNNRGASRLLERMDAMLCLIDGICMKDDDGERETRCCGGGGAGYESTETSPFVSPYLHRHRPYHPSP